MMLMMRIRRTGAWLAALALLTSTLVAFLPCDMAASETPWATAGRADHASGAPADHHQHHTSPGSSGADGAASQTPDESGTPAPGCLISGPCAPHLLGPAPGSLGPRRAAQAVVALAATSEPPSRTLAPELPPPRA